ncbi:transposase [Confluentibacter lentus]|uniref:transposase n=1 Tax=Confluentibacter lentus TaxID=1699412 RepID=UPI0018E247B6|nr:transposase [Confluentibacter lentus]
MNTYNPNIHHRRSIRLKGYDYSQAGLYFITICCQDRACLFGEIVVGTNGIRPEMKLNKYGEIAHNEWMKTPEIRNNVQLGEFVIMPNHIHGIIRLLGRGELHSPHNENNNKLHSPENAMDHSSANDNELHSPANAIKHSSANDNKLHSSTNAMDHSPENAMGIMGENTMGEFDSQQIMGEFDSPLRGPSHNIGAIVRGYKSSVTKQLNLLNIGCTVWQRNYHEHIIRNEQSYQRISEYIINNPAKWNDDKFYRQ